MLEEILRYDKELFLMLNTLGSSTWDGFWMFITNKFSSIPLYALLIYLAYKQFGLKKTGVLIVSALLMIVVVNGLADFFKYGVARLRPCYDLEVNALMRLVKDSCGGKFGYFSAHAANSMAIATFFSLLLRHGYKYAMPLLLLWACLVAYSRIYIGVHFPLDVLTGIGVGAFFGWLFARLYTFALLRFSI